MKHYITGNMAGRSITFSIDGRPYTKICATDEAAHAFMKAMLDAKQNPTDEAIETLLTHLNQNMRVAKENGLEYDVETGLVYLPGFSTPIPKLLVSVIEDYHEHGYPKESIVNFWKLLMINPDKRVRESLFDFINTHDFTITDNGYMIVYKAVNFFSELQSDLNTFVTNAAYHVRKDWKCSPAKYAVYQDEEGDYKITKETTIDGWDLKEKGVVYVGNLKELEDKSDELSNKEDAVSFLPQYVGWHKDSFDLETERIRLGVPQKMKRIECDSDPAISCSYGLHVGATNYVKTFGSGNCPVLVCLVNPANVVAVPNYDHSKMRVSEYFPIALADRADDGTIDNVQQSYFEHDYIDYEKEELERQLEAINNEEERVGVDCHDAEDDRALEEVMKTLESRVVDLADFA